MINERAIEPKPQQSKVILWDSQVGQDIDKLLPAELTQSITLIKLVNFAQVVDYLQSHNDVSLVATVLRPTDLQMLYQIQQLQQHYSDVAIVAMVGAVNRLASVTRVIQQHIMREYKQNNGLKYGSDTSDKSIANIVGEDDKAEIECHLTPRQRDVLALLMRGQSNKQIARILDLSEGTVKIHCMAIFRELGVANRTQAALRAEQIMPDLCYAE